MTHDATYRTVSEQVVEAREAILELVRADNALDPYYLKTRARNGGGAGAATLAFNELLDEGALEVTPDGVRLSTS